MEIQNASLSCYFCACDSSMIQIYISNFVGDFSVFEICIFFEMFVGDFSAFEILEILWAIKVFLNLYFF